MQPFADDFMVKPKKARIPHQGVIKKGCKVSKYLCVGLVYLLMLVVLWMPTALAQSSETKIYSLPSAFRKMS